MTHKITEKRAEKPSIQQEIIEIRNKLDRLYKPPVPLVRKTAHVLASAHHPEKAFLLQKVSRLGVTLEISSAMTPIWQRSRIKELALVPDRERNAFAQVIFLLARN
jgi:hypothetical protein